MCTGFPKEDKRFLKLKSIPDQLNDSMIMANIDFSIGRLLWEVLKERNWFLIIFFFYNLYLLSSILLLFVVITFVTVVIKCKCMKFCMF